jgi:hypothetical protein
MPAVRPFVSTVLRAAAILAWLAAASVAGAQDDTDTPTPAPTATATASRTATIATRTSIATRTVTASATGTQPSTPTGTASITRTPSRTRTGTVTRTGTPEDTPTKTITPSRTATGSRTPVPSRTATGTVTSTGTPTRTGTPAAAFIAVQLIADRRGDNNDGTFTTVVSALVSDANGNPVGNGIGVIFSLAPPVGGVTIAQVGETNEPPACDVSSYVAATGLPINPQPGLALTCLNYSESREGDEITVRAQVVGPNGLIEALREIRLPAPPPPSPSATGSATRTSPPTATATITQTGTATITPTEAPTGTPTETPLAPLRVAALGGSARPGETASIRFDLADAQGRVHELTFDILIDAPVFDVFPAAQRCQLDPSISTHSLSAMLTLDPFVPIGKRRYRFVISDFMGRQLRAGRLVNCILPVADDAPLGASPLTLDRTLAGDENGELIVGLLPVNGVLIIDPDAPLPTATGTNTATPTASSTSTVTATRTATPTRTDTPTPTATATATATPTVTATATATASATTTAPPTATDTPQPTDTPTLTPTDTPTITPTPSTTPVACVGDCDGRGTVSINELILAVNISTDAASVEQCRAIDRNASGTASIDELVAAVNNAVDGCG